MASVLQHPSPSGGPDWALVPDGDREPTRGCLYFWGRGNTAAILGNPAYWGGAQFAVAGAGIPVWSSDFHSPTHWGNDTAVATVDPARARMDAALEPRRDKVLLLGISIGATLALNWARQHSTDVAAVALITPVVDLRSVHAMGLYSGEIEQRHGGRRRFRSGLEMRNPAQYAEDLSSIPIAVWYSADDPICTPASVERFARESGADLALLGAVGHTADSLDGSAVATFLREHA